MSMYVCGICSHLAFDSAPDKCPVCGAPKEKFAENPDTIKKVADPSNMTELEKKHTPVIVINKECGLIPGDCYDVHVKVGEIEHPRATDHWIQFIDFYLDKKYITRVMLAPEAVHPAAALHLVATEGTITAVELCNKHGIWMNEAKI